MIDFVKGTIVDVGEETITIEAYGLGYQIFVPSTAPYEIIEEVCIHTHFVVREDAHTLYGFQGTQERDLFRLLLTVSGVGPKAALGMLSRGTPQQLSTAIQLEDMKYLTKLPGIGKKTAQRLILDLKDKGLWIYGADMEGENYHFNTELKGAIGLVIGNEGKGLSRLVKERCDVLVKIPMLGKIESLNASNAASILIYEVVRQGHG